MNTTERIYCIPGDRFPANFILNAFADANAELPNNAPNTIVVIPDLKGQLPDKFLPALRDLAPRQAYLLSSVTIYGNEYCGATENTPTANTPEARQWINAEHVFTEECLCHNVIPTVLRLPLLIGTGMTGEIRQRLNAIYRGIYRHIQDVAPQQSVLHARDLPEIIAGLNGVGGVFNVSDGNNPSTREIAEALSARMGAKRIYTVKAKWARIAARFADLFGLKDLGSTHLRSVSATRTVDITRLKSKCPDWSPTETVDFLLNHNYSSIDT